MAELTIQTGMWYANALIVRYCGIEAQRLVEKLAATSHQPPATMFMVQDTHSRCLPMNGLKIARKAALWINDANFYL
jgi:hypothetical protein